MGMRVERRVCVAVRVLSAVVAIAATARAASAAGKGPTVRVSNAETDNGRSESGGGLRVGALGGIGFPCPLTIEGVIGFDRALAVGADYGFLPQSTIGGVDMTLWSLAGSARVFPFHGPFFLGLRGGHQRLGAERTASLGTFGTVTDVLTVDTWFINPRIGALWMWDSWLAVGIEAGVQIPLSSSVSNTLPDNLPNDPRVTNATRNLNTLGETLGSSVLPTIDLLRIGFML
jgi:hypothetical protein